MSLASRLQRWLRARRAVQPARPAPRAPRNWEDSTPDERATAQLYYTRARWAGQDYDTKADVARVQDAAEQVERRLGERE